MLENKFRQIIEMFLHFKSSKTVISQFFFGFKTYCVDFIIMGFLKIFIRLKTIFKERFYSVYARENKRRILKWKRFVLIFSIAIKSLKSQEKPVSNFSETSCSIPVLVKRIFIMTLFLYLFLNLLHHFFSSVFQAQILQIFSRNFQNHHIQILQLHLSFYFRPKNLIFPKI